jgi:hypothetical protein
MTNNWPVTALRIGVVLGFAALGLWVLHYVWPILVIAFAGAGARRASPPYFRRYTQSGGVWR